MGSITKEEFLYVINELYDIYKSCSLCPRACGVNRLKGEIGECKVGKDPVVASYFPHFGEERVLVGKRGSGTIFFSGCNLHCVFCQNYDISQYITGTIMPPKELAKIMLHLQYKGTHNINLVSPTHFLPPIIEAIYIAKQEGLKIPIVYNTGGYDSPKVIKLLEGIVDIYLPDAKYGNSTSGEKYSDVKNYTKINQIILKEMYRQVGNLEIEKINGFYKIAKKGLIIRHLVLPKNSADSKKVLDFIRYELSDEVAVNIMEQYTPEYIADTFPELHRRLLRTEYYEVVEYAKRIGLKNLL
jgi:putative pyruvate formate lyase activating enzyme